MTPPQIILLVGAVTELLQALLPALRDVTTGQPISAERQLAVRQKLDAVRGMLADLPDHWKPK